MINEYFDKVFYMNLSDRTDRKEAIEAQLQALGITAERVESVDGRVFKENEKGERVQVQSVNEHGLLTTYCALNDTLISIFERAKAEQWESFLVFEDDAVFADNFIEVMQEATEKRFFTQMVDDTENPIDLKDPITGEVTGTGFNKIEQEVEYSYLPADWDILNLGAIKGQYANKHQGGSVYKLRDFSLGTALAFRSTVYDQCLELLREKKSPSDVCFSYISLSGLGTIKSYGFFPAIVTQPEGHSDCLGYEVEAKVL